MNAHELKSTAAALVAGFFLRAQRPMRVYARKMR
jgi:hypothetical protein